MTFNSLVKLIYINTKLIPCILWNGFVTPWYLIKYYKIASLSFLNVCKRQTKYEFILLLILTAILRGRCRCVAQGYSLSGRQGIWICPTNSGIAWMSMGTVEVQEILYIQVLFSGILLHWQCVLFYPPKFSGVSKPIVIWLALYVFLKIPSPK